MRKPRCIVKCICNAVIRTSYRRETWRIDLKCVFLFFKCNAIVLGIMTSKSSCIIKNCTVSTAYCIWFTITMKFMKYSQLWNYPLKVIATGNVFILNYIKMLNSYIIFFKHNKRPIKRLSCYPSFTLWRWTDLYSFRGWARCIKG